MKRFTVLMVVLIAISSLGFAQKLVIGERAPELKIKEWIDKKPTQENKARLIEFFYSASAPSVKGLSSLDNLADRHKAKLVVIVIAKESKEKLVEVINPSARNFYTALDDNGKSFSSFSVQFVPFAVLIDARGKVQWMGNSTSLTDEVINKFL